MGGHVFISHSAQNAQIANTICQILEQEGIRCWIAPRDIQGGDQWATAIVQAVKDACLMVLLFSSETAQSTEVLKELRLAANHRIGVLPVRLEEVRPVNEFEYELCTRQWLDVFPPPLEKYVGSLIAAVRTQAGLGTRNAPASCPESDGSSALVMGLEEADSRIRKRAAQLKWPSSLPTSEVGPSPFGTRGFNCRRGDGKSALYCHASGPRRGLVFLVKGGIGWLYLTQLGGAKSYLGLPVTDEIALTSAARSDFEGGFIEWLQDDGIARAYSVAGSKTRLELERKL